VFTNALGWAHGYYETVRNEPLGPSDQLERHVFRATRGPRWDEVYYVDECGRETDPPPDGRASLFAVESYRAIDDDISDALGVPRAPLDDRDRAELAKRGRSAKPVGDTGA
jgi:hypothetical protein